MANEGSIKTSGLLTKVKDRLRGAKSYAQADGRKESRERLYRKLKGQYYSTVEMADNRERIKVENIAGLTFQMRPSYHFRRPHVSVNPLTPKFITELNGQEKKLNNVRNAKIAEIALNQELAAIDIDGEVNSIIQDWLCPYEFGALKVGFGNKTLYSSYDVDKVNTEGVWALRTCPDDIFVDWQAHGRRSVGYYFHAIHKPLQWIKDNQDFNPRARAAATSEKTPEYLKSRLRSDGVATPYDMGCVYEYHDLETGQIAVLTEDGTDWLMDPYDFPYKFKGSQFVFLNPMPLNNDFYGRCYTGLAEPQVDETNSYRTRILRIFKRFPVMNLFKKGAWTVEQQRKWAEGDDAENIEVNEPKDIDTRTMPQLPSDVWNMQEMMERDMEKVLGTSAMRRGEVTATKPTTAQIIEGHGNIRDADVREEVAKVYKIASSKLLDLMIQFYDKPRWVKLTGTTKVPEDLNPEQTDAGPFALYSNADIAGNYDFDPDVASMSPVNNEAKAKVLLETVKTIPTLHPDDQKEFRRKFNIVSLLEDVVKMQGADLSRWENEEEPDSQMDPWAENEWALRGGDQGKGGILQHPGKNEPHQFHHEVHSRVLQLLAVNPMDPRFIELARHDQLHQAEIANQKNAQAAPPPMAPGQAMPGIGPMTGPTGLPISQGNVPNAAPPGPQLPPTPGGFQ